MKDKERIVTCFSESPIVSYKRNDNLSEIFTSSYTKNLQVNRYAKKTRNDDGFAAI